MNARRRSSHDPFVTLPADRPDPALFSAFFSLSECPPTSGERGERAVEPLLRWWRGPLFRPSMRRARRQFRGTTGSVRANETATHLANPPFFSPLSGGFTGHAMLDSQSFWMHTPESVRPQLGIENNHAARTLAVGRGNRGAHGREPRNGLLTTSSSEHLRGWGIDPRGNRQGILDGSTTRQVSSMNALFAAAKEVCDFMKARRWKFCVIGGLAVQRWGELRTTLDADLTLFTDSAGKRSTSMRCWAGLPPVRPRPGSLLSPVGYCLFAPPTARISISPWAVFRSRRK